MHPPITCKLVCPKCGYSKIGTLGGAPVFPPDSCGLCPKCEIRMEIKRLNMLESIMLKFKK